MDYVHGLSRRMDGIEVYQVEVILNEELTNTGTGTIGTGTWGRSRGHFGYPRMLSYLDLAG